MILLEDYGSMAAATAGLLVMWWAAARIGRWWRG